MTPGFRPLTGGVEAHTCALTTEFVKYGLKVDVLTARRGVRRARVDEYQGHRVVTYPAWSVRSMSISPRLVWGAFKRRRGAALLHVHSYHATTALAVLGARTPTVFTPHYHGRHGHSAVANILHVAFYPLARLLLARCDAVITVSDAERRQLLHDFPCATDRVVVIPNGIELSAIRTATPLHDQPPTVLCVGRLEPYKRFADVITAFAQVPPPAQLVIVGDGSQRAKLLALGTDLGIAGRVKLVGGVSNRDLHRWFRTAKVLVSYSEREAFGMVALEAAAGGARIVLSDIAAHREIAAQYLGDCGLVVPHRCPSGLAAAIRQQLRAPRTEPAAIYDWPEIAARTVAVYRSVAGDLIAEPQCKALENERIHR
ncbi:MAG: glycosyltransferase family 4 protein [Mycobacteriaceae bacterium]|nr:glycosyltransferase family 4 protein [Mycobacteriaceae bacterium]